MLHRMRSGCSGMNRQNLYARSAVLIDADSGRVLFGKDSRCDPSDGKYNKDHDVYPCVGVSLREHPDQTIEVSDQAVSQPKVHLGCRKEKYSTKRSAVFSDAGIAQ